MTRAIHRPDEASRASVACAQSPDARRCHGLRDPYAELFDTVPMCQSCELLAGPESRLRNHDLQSAPAEVRHGLLICAKRLNRGLPGEHHI